MAAESHQLHFLLVPFLCPGHLIPMADIAGVLAQHGVIVTIVTTPINAIPTKPIIDRLATEGCESLESWSIVPSRALTRNFFDAVSKLQKPLEQLIEELELISTCILVDKFLYWAPQVLFLSLPAVGAYLTNCVGNSTVEQICAGVPMITWPMFTDQFFNEKLIVQILETSERLGTEVAVPMGKQEKFGAMIKWDKISEAIDKVKREGTRKAEKREKK